MLASNTKTLPFTQFVPPYGKRVQTEFNCADDVHTAGTALLERGLRFEIEKLSNGWISATIADPELEDDVAHSLIQDETKTADRVSKMILEFYHGN